MTSSLPRVFPVAVIGATGVGKSKLAIEIARRFNGEVINADSMQIYKGLDIVTNKVTPEERAEATHHLLDYVDPLNERHSIVDFRSAALPIIDDLLAAGKTPVICGGTMYYVEALLWNTLIAQGRDVPDGPLPAKEMRKLDGAELYGRLKECDPATAAQIHPNDKRKILRALEVFEQSGKTRTEWLKEQWKEGKSRLRGALRFPESPLFWVESEAPVLNERLDKRVDAMVEAGLVKEMLEFHDVYNQSRIGPKDQKKDYTTGIFQSIGFKEFHPYLMMSEECRDSLRGRAAFAEGLDLLKLHTKQYTRSQRQWIENRFLEKSTEEERLPPVFKLDSTNVDSWNSEVRDKAFEVLERLRLGSEVTSTSLLPLPVTVKPSDTFESPRDCLTCQMTFISKKNFDIHVSSKKHKALWARREKARTDLVRTLEAVEAVKKGTDGDGEIRTCRPCKRTFDSAEKLTSHETSKKHKRKCKLEAV